jgi:uncharacterized protein YxjI
MSDFQYIQSTITRDKDYPARQFAVDVLTRVLRGTLYREIPNGFHDEKNGAGEYVPIRHRRPSVRHNLCRTVVDDSVSLLFSEGHFPDIQIDDETSRKTLAAIVKESKVNALMIDAATKGSVGSVAMLMRVLEGRLFFDAMETQYLTPVWKATAPDTLEKVIERYKVKGSDLAAAGYTGLDDAEDYWLHTEWDEAQELRYAPYSVKDAKEKDFTPTIDKKRTTSHKLGTVPMVWIRNLPGGDAIDGEPTFPTEAIDTQIELDYQLSQAGRGLKYSSDPLLMIKEPASPGGELVKGAGNALIVQDKGDAKLLEISGSAAAAVIEYCKYLRQLALEGMHGNRADADKMSAAQSGRAMELMNQALIWLADRLRISYGEGALLQLVKLIALASRKYKLKVDGVAVAPISDKPVALNWPSWYAPTYSDRQAMATTLQTHTASGHMSRETAVKSIAEDYDIEDVKAEIAQIEKEAAFDAEMNAKSKPLQQQPNL